MLVLCTGFLSAQDEQTVADIIAGSEDHETLEAALVAAGLDDDLDGEGSFTVFAPTDAAFEMLPDGALEFLLMEANQDSLAAILNYHVVPGDTMAADLMDGMMLPTLSEGDSLFIRIMGETVMVNGAMITMADMEASNGVVHVIDAVLMPPAATVVEVIMNTDTLSTLAAAIEAADEDLAETLMGDGPFTVFAPSNDALANITMDSLAALQTSGALETILTYHVVPGRYTSADLMDGMMLMTVQGEMLEVTISGDSILVDSSLIIMTDMMADNGIVHVIDSILLPMAITSTEEPAFAREVKLFPNPTSSQLYVELPASILGSATLTLRDLSGRTLATRRATNDREPLEVGALPTGTYLLEIRAAAGVIQRKVMVQR